MRVNVYAEEMTDRIEIVEKEISNGITVEKFTGLRMYMYLPVTRKKAVVDAGGQGTVGVEQVQGPFIHNEGDDDSAAVTFWGKADLRDVLIKALHKLDRHYAERRERERNSITVDNPGPGGTRV